MASSTNFDGYDHALRKTWENYGKPASETPSKSSLSEARSKISYEFFEDIFRHDLKRTSSNRKFFRNYHVYAIDGDQLELPASQDIIEKGFRGYPTSKKRETHYPKMYTAQALDVVNGMIRDFGFSQTQDEVYLARKMVEKFEQNSITLYDRLHCGYETYRAHQKANNFFIVRARTSEYGQRGTRGANRIVYDFCHSRARDKMVDWKYWRNYYLGEERPSIAVRLVKVRNPKTKNEEVFVTNLPRSQFSAKEIADLYCRRWDIETSFKDITHLLKMGQWHSKNLNGVLQEIFSLLWLTNSTRRCMENQGHFPSKDLLKKEYRKANFKMLVCCIMDHIGLLLLKKWKTFFEILKVWICRTSQKRTRNSRAYPRVVKHRGKEYKQANAVPRRPKLTEQH